MLVLSYDDVVGLGLGAQSVMSAVEDALRAQAAGVVDQPAKLHVGRPEGGLFHALAARAPEQAVAGVKWVSYTPGNTRRGLPTTGGTMVLSDDETGLPLAVMDAIWLTRARTGACAAVTASRLARPGARVLTLVGAGPACRGCVPYLLHALPGLDEVRIVTRSAASAAAAARRLSERIRPTVRAYADVPDALDGADVVLSAIGHPDRPPLRAAWLGAGALALPLEGEAAWESALFTGADLVVADDVDGLRASLAAHRPGDAAPDRVVQLAQVVAGQVAGRRDPADRIVVSNNGIAVLDLVLAARIHAAAVAAGVGQHVAAAPVED